MIQSKSWPGGEVMTVACPWCSSANVVQIAVCKEVGHHRRPVECDSCRRDYELREGGQTLKTVVRRNADGFLQDHYVEETGGGEQLELHARRFARSRWR